MDSLALSVAAIGDKLTILGLVKKTPTRLAGQFGGLSNSKYVDNDFNFDPVIQFPCRVHAIIV